MARSTPRAKSNRKSPNVNAKKKNLPAITKKKNKSNHFYSSDGSPLYPTIALSDAYNTITHVLAGIATYHLNEFIGLGFFLVAAASFIGTLRFGFSEKAFGKANGELATIAAFIGLPLIGIANIERINSDIDNNTSYQSSTTIILLLFLYIFATSIVSDSIKEVLILLVNVVLFVAPVYYEGYYRGSNMEIFAITLFIIGTVIIGNNRHKCVLGMRCENWFHYCLGTSAYLMANEFASAMKV